jgi:pimeloyl-ACP methyl ester carboxylesterase
MGQVHYGIAGTGTPILLLHQTPWFCIQYARAQPLLAAGGMTAVVVDTPGYGFSDLPHAPPTIENYADNLVALLDHLGFEKVVIGGHHTGASIASAFAARHPQRTAGLFMHGLPLYTAEERADRLRTQVHNDTSVWADGGHYTARWQRVKERFAREASAESVQWSVLGFVLAGDTEWYGHDAAFRFEMAAALATVQAPTLVMSNTADSVHMAAARALKLRPDFSYHEFPGGTPHMMYDDPEPWAAAVLRFVDDLPERQP